MASTSSSTTTDSHPDNVTRYDVFLSFRGEDTRNSFTDHLYHALVRAGLHTFRDNDEIERGEEVNLAIVRAIEASEASIVVLSPNYANSTWCLDELRLILEERRVRNHFVLPVFYHVDPSDVRKQSKDFTINVKSCGRWSVHNVNMWKAALTEVADLAGLTLSGPETIFLKTIVDTIYNKLDRKQVHLPHNLIGMGARVKEINSWLRDPDTRFLVICGMGGSGKTTLARYIVYSNWQNYDNISIIEDIGSRCTKPHDLLQLQEKLFGDIFWGKKRKIPSVCQGTFKIEEALQKNKALIVLDDIVEQSQLFVLLGSGNINKQSKIVITTRESSTFKWFEFRSWRCQEYKMELLDEDESLELLSLHAFGSKIVMEGYEELAKKVLKYCEGNPLALEVLGSSLQEDNSIPSWESALNMLEKDIHPGIHRVLVRSYNLLPYDIDRELFLHIACFFIGEDMDYVVKILEHDYLAMSRIKTLTKRCLLSISPNKKLLMHPLLQEMGRTIVHQESPKDPAKRSRVWCNKESYDLLWKGKGSKTMEGLALDMKTLREGKYALKAPTLWMDSLENMDKLKLLQLKYVQLTGSYGNFSEHLRWICWIGFHLRTIPGDLFLGNLVALDMSYSSLEIFELPMVLKSLQFLNLQDSHNLCAIRSMFLLPNLETLILWNCHKLSYVCETIEGLKSLVLLNMTGCENLCKISGKITTFSLPHTLQQLFLKDCYIECTDSFPLGFSVQAFLQYLNLGNSLFEFLPDYNHLKSLRVLDLTLCSRLKQLLFLPSTLAELYVYYCLSLEKITFQSCQFTLQEFGYEGCTSLCEIEGFIKLIPLSILDEADLGHMKWLKEYQNHEVCLVGDDELTIGRSFQLQMLYEFNIMSTSLPDIKDANLMPEYISASPSLSFDVPLCPKDKRLKGLNISFKYTTLAEENWVWFAKISTTNGVDLMYNPKLFGKPAVEEVGIWLSYWPIGNTLKVGDKVNVSIVVVNGLEIHECGANLVYIDDEEANETIQNDMELVDILGGGLSRFQLTTGAYYMCRRDFFELMEDGKATNSWFRVLVGDTIDHTEVRGWRKTGRPQPSDQSFTELKTIRCIIHGPESDQFYNIAERAKPSFADETREFTSSIHETMKSDSLENRFQIGKNIQSHSEEDTKSPLVSHQQALAHVTAQAAFSQSYFNHVQVQPENGSSAPEVELQMVNAVNASSELENSQIGSPDGFAGSQADVTEPQQLVYMSADANDGYNWRKYGQKQVKASEHPRSYYKCTYVNCPVKKKVGQSLDGHITDIVYKGQHNHEPPQHSKRAKKDADVSRPNGSQFERRLVEGSVADRGSNQFVRVDQGANNQLMRSDQGSNQLIRIDEPDDEPNPKRRNTEAGPVSVPVDPTSAQKMVSEPKIVVSTRSEVDLLDDGFKWRKYGQKVVKGNTNPRCYYKCTYAGCKVRKHVERAPSDPKSVVTTYEGEHNHDIPVARHRGYNNKNGEIYKTVTA